MRFHSGGIGADARFRQREGRDFASCKSRQVFLTLVLGTEKHKRLRNTNGLVGGQQSRHVAAPASEQHRGAAIVCLRKPEAAVFRRNLDSERSQPGESLDDLIGNFSGLVNPVRIGAARKKILQPAEKGVSLVSIFHGLLGKGHDLRQIVAPEEQSAGEGPFH